MSILDPEVCEECYKETPRSFLDESKRTCPPKFHLEAWVCYRKRRKTILYPLEKKVKETPRDRCRLRLPVFLHIQMTFDIICLQVCGVAVEHKDTFDVCFGERCPVAIRMEHAQFALDNQFTSYLDMQFSSMNPLKLHLDATEHEIKRRQKLEKELNENIPWVKHDGPVER